MSFRPGHTSLALGDASSVAVGASSQSVSAAGPSPRKKGAILSLGGVRRGAKPQQPEPQRPRDGGYSQEELDEYRQVFSLFDTDGSGAIGVDELGNAMLRLGMHANKRELEKLIREVDEDGNGEIDFDEFCAVMKRMSAKSVGWHDVAKQCFDVFDRNESGVISEADFRHVLRQLGGIEDDAVVDAVFAEVDVDGNGTIDFDEFASMVRDYMTDDDLDAYASTANRLQPA